MWDAWGREMGLDRPLVVQYLVWAGKAVRGDLGISLWARRPVIEVIAEKLPATLLLGSSTFLFILVGVPLGVMSAVQRGSISDYAGRTFAVMGLALPPFWVGLMLILIFSVQLDWLPPGKRGGIQHLVLPSITLGWGFAAGVLRLVRSSLLDVLDAEYIKLARAKGVSRGVVIWKHAFKNASIPPLTYGGLLLASLFTGAVVTESVFGWPGVGRLAVDAVTAQNDFPMLSGLVMLFTLMFVTFNLVVDVVYAYIDPRIRYS
jgi:peptide/nickel transport system permease protein